MIVPAILSGILTVWKVDLGNASRVVVVAGLTGATGVSATIRRSPMLGSTCSLVMGLDKE